MLDKVESRSQSVESSVLSNSSQSRHLSRSNSISEDETSKDDNDSDSEANRLLDEAAEILNHGLRKESSNATSSAQSCVSSGNSRAESPMPNVDGTSSTDDFFGELKEKMLHIKNRNEVLFNRCNELYYRE